MNKLFRKLIIVTIPTCMILFLLPLSCICKSQKYVKEWIGREIILPDKLPLINATEGDSTNYNKTKKATVLLVTDSLQCAPCQLKLDSWFELIKQFSDDVRFTFVVYPRTKIQMYARCKVIGFNYPLCIDENTALDDNNHFPKDIFYRCFLLDSDNKVLLIGNPMFNEKLLYLYISTIEQIIHNDENTH